LTSQTHCDREISSSTLLEMSSLSSSLSSSTTVSSTFPTNSNQNYQIDLLPIDKYKYKELEDRIVKTIKMIHHFIEKYFVISENLNLKIYKF
jgi:hypothetical protein